MISCNPISDRYRRRVLVAMLGGACILVQGPMFNEGLSATARAEPRPVWSAMPPVVPATAQYSNGSHSFHRTPNGNHVDPIATGSIAAGVFSSVAFPFKPSVARRWSAINASAQNLLLDDCAEATGCEERKRRLAAAVESARNQPLLQKIAAINTAVNHAIAYKSDQEIYGRLDHWAEPSEVLRNGQGDCEDFAILKMAALKEAGVPLDSASLVVLRDTQRNLYHAILAVQTSRNIYVLDNVRDVVLTDQQLPHYQALYSLSEQKTWIHGYKRGSVYTAQGRPVSLDAVQPGEGAPAGS